MTACIISIVYGKRWDDTSEFEGEVMKKIYI